MWKHGRNVRRVQERGGEGAGPGLRVGRDHNTSEEAYGGGGRSPVATHSNVIRNMSIRKKRHEKEEKRNNNVEGVNEDNVRKKERITEKNSQTGFL